VSTASGWNPASLTRRRIVPDTERFQCRRNFFI
jgi:hypothetical protein